MIVKPAVDECPNCGAPLELDEAGRCRYCRAHVQVELPPAAGQVGYFDDQAGLVPGGLDDCFSSSPFVYLTLSMLGLLGRVPAVLECTRVRGIHQIIRSLSTAVSEAGVRVRDAGLLKNDLDNGLKPYTPEEIWIFDLAIDVIAMLGALDGLPGDTRALVANGLRSLDDEVDSRRWRKERSRAEEGLQAFRECRAQVPRHTPRPRR